jgi:predicted XRE-type DNA-binding protein
MVIHRRSGDERILTETELVDAQVCEAESGGDQASERIVGLDGLPGLEDDAESAAIRNELISEVRKIPGYDVWHMSEILGMRQDEIGETLGLSQGRVSQLLKQFKEQARTLVDDN